MAPFNLCKFIIFLSLFSTFTNFHVQSKRDGFISISISEKGLEFVKDLLTEKAVSSLTPLELSPIEKTVRIPLVGSVKIVLSNIVIYHIDVIYSDVEVGDDDISITASKATANLSMDWKYTYKNWFVEVSDHGDASVEVDDMKASIEVTLKKQGGGLKLTLLESECEVEDVDIKMNGGASWLYQGIVDAFSNHIESAVENAIIKKLNEGILKIGTLLQSLPTQVKVDETSALNVTFVSNPTFSDSSIGFVINGLFIPMNESLSTPYQLQVSQSSIQSHNPAKMIAIALHEDVFNSGSLVYFNAGLMQWRVEKIPDQSLLNTTLWKEVVPELYEQFPDSRMVLDLLASSPPSVHIFDGGMEATINTDVIVDVMSDGEVVPVACGSVVISASGSVKISGNNLTGSIELDKFNLSAKWSKVGNLQIDVIRPVISEVLVDVLLPRLNTLLVQGFPLPLIHGFTLEDAEIVYSDSLITVSSNVAYTEDNRLPSKYIIRDILSFLRFM
ncbi:putative BPI/LBP family protein At1g04970 [Amaranthus tricolor]|uniref:putative BPI/LBP family protein At1g04970 n=1 Tax=Amaranthus tricolor TaxID=29722 RepID=UPI00258A5EE3|nr:putative BPI/LBP family protein At1g04970 [Amaranthus tricolor]